MNIYRMFDQVWRWLGTVISFIAFGFGGLLILLFISPLIRLLPADEKTRRRRGKRVIQLAFRFFIGLMKALGVLSYTIKDIAKLKEARLVLANHPSLIDVIFLIAFTPNANCVVKGPLSRNLFTRGPIKSAGYIINESGSDVICEAEKAFAEGDALIVFPEGTRTVPEQPVTLKRGAANIAVRTNSDITPVLISCWPSTLTKSDRWYQVPAKKVQLSLEVRDLIEIKPYQQLDNPSKSARQLTRDLCDFFNAEIVNYERLKPRA